ncbi:MAG: PAS domain-containing sensor histidine kinase [Acidimicrobiia bacterium]
MITVIAFAITVGAVGLALLFFNRARGLSHAVDAARQRIGGDPPKRAWHRRGALEEALHALERSTSHAQKERSQLAGALQAAQLGIIITDDHGAVTFANQPADQYLGARQGEAITEAKLKEAIEQAILNRTTVSTEVESGAPVIRVVEVGVVPLDFGVESVGAVAYLQDITEQRRVIETRRDFIANVSHELTTPLSALAALCEAVADSLDDAEVARRLVSRLGDESTRLTALVDSILQLSQAEAQTAQTQAVQISELTENAADQMRHTVTERGAELIVEPVPPDVRVGGDERQLRSLLVGLIDNAAKFSKTQEGAAPPRIWLRTSVQDELVIIAVQDEGIGIAQDQVDRIFERFYRIDRSAPGTGLGLSIVRHIARDHGGEVEVMSKPEEGSIFTVTLPVWGE